MDVDQLPPDPRPGRWVPLERVTKRTSQGYLGNLWDPSVNHADLKILVIGAGGLGCEILKNLALSGFRDIDVIDMDTIDLSNLNRQFLFRKKDVGHPKATVAAEFVMKRVPGVRVTPHFGKIEDKPDSFYLEFQIVILGLDSLHARQWMNDKLCSLILWEDQGGKFAVANPDAIPPIIDGGTEGFKGHVRMIRPTLTASFNSTMWMFPPQVAFPMCTLESVPRLPEHCVAYIKEKIWEDEKPFDGVKLDGDNTDHIQWITQRAQERADKFGIKGVDFRFTQGVVKNIIPAIASTNAVVSAGCVLEALKIATGASRPLKNYTVYNGSSVDQGIYCQTQNLLPELDDHQAGPPTIVAIGADWTVERFLNDGIIAQYETESGRKLTSPEKVSVWIGTSRGQVYLISRGSLAYTTAAKQKKPLLEFVDLKDPYESIIYIRSAELSEDINAYGKIKLRIV